jgi:hypothetical protein
MGLGHVTIPSSVPEVIREKMVVMVGGVVIHAGQM